MVSGASHRPAAGSCRASLLGAERMFNVLGCSEALLFGEASLDGASKAGGVGHRWLDVPGQGLSWRFSHWSQPIYGMVTVAFQSQGTSLSPLHSDNLTHALRNTEAIKCPWRGCGCAAWVAGVRRELYPPSLLFP